MRLALAQLNPTIGAIEHNTQLIERAIERARSAGADLLITPELSICGYPPKDLLLREGFSQRCVDAAKHIGETMTDGLAVVLGCPLPIDNGLANSLLLYRDNSLVGHYDKRLLPTYDVFDEDRYFTAGDRAAVHEIAGVRVGLSICEDLWKGEDVGFADQHARDEDPVRALVGAGAQLIVNPSGSPFVLGKGRRHRELLIGHARRHGVAVASTNQVGGNDELIFDGHACVYDARGTLLAAGPGFEEHVLVCDIDARALDAGHEDPPASASSASGGVVDPRLEAPAEELLFRALTLGVRDYARKTGFERVVLGLSGGIDSAVTAVIAAAALGPGNVTCLAMPGKYSSEHSVADARDLAERLGARFVVVPIEDAFQGARTTIDAGFDAIGERLLGQSLPDIAEENLQSRIRGMVVMAHSNRTGDLVLTTGNKSELAVGYCTLYGDMNGGLAVLSDVLKTQVYAIAQWINEHFEALAFASPPIPQNTIDKPPSAELAPDQKDIDSLPPYDVLDGIVGGLIEEKLSPATLVSRGFDEQTVARIARLIDRTEYKRKQLATGLKVSGVAFGFGRRMPIAQGWT